MPTFETPYGTVDAPSLEAAQKFIANKGGGQGKPADQPSQISGIWQALVQGVGRGARDVVDSGASIGARMMAAAPDPGVFDNPAAREAMPGRVAAEITQGEQAYGQNPSVAAHPWAAMTGRIGGNVAASAPLAAVPGASGAGMALGGRALLGAGLGAATGGAPGAVIGGATGGLGAMIGPRLNAAFQAIAKDHPNLARMAIGAEGRTPEAFQRATANEVLYPIGQTIDRAIKVGHDLINETGKHLNNAYKTVLSDVIFPYEGRQIIAGPSGAAELAPTFKSGLPAIRDGVPTAHTGDFDKLIKSRFEDKLDANGALDGEAYKAADQAIGQKARRYSGPNATPDNLEYAEALRDLQATMRDTLKQYNQRQAPILDKVDTAWARYVRMEEAAGRKVAQDGQFTPLDLLTASGKEKGHRAFAHGDQLMQAFGRAGKDLLEGKPPNMPRLSADLIGAGVGGAVGHHVAGPVGGYLGAATGAAAAEGGRKLLQPLLRQTETPGARKVGAAVGRSAPVTGALGRRAYVSAVGP